MVAHAAPKHAATVKTTGLQLKIYAFLLLISMLCSTYIEFCYEMAGLAKTGIGAGIAFGNMTVGSLVRLGAVFMLLFVPLCILSRHKNICRLIIRARYPLAILLLVLLVFFEISGSSIGIWQSWIDGMPMSGVLFGIPRTVRSDEWLVFTPFSFSQVATGNHAISEVIRGTSTDVTMVYGQPAWAPATLFRPFLWGYMVLGAARGLSFFWCARAICLVLATYEFMLLLTNNHRSLSAYGALLVGFCPLIEWWFAVNGTAELLIFGQGLVYVFHHVLRANSRIHRIGLTLVLAWFLGCYALVLYPAWQVCFAYVFSFLALADLCYWLKDQERGKRAHACRRVAPYFIVALMLSALSVGACMYLSWDTIQHVLHTAYPGGRLYTGGGLSWYLSSTFATPISSIWPDLFTPNVCESVSWISLFPLGLCFAVVLVVKGVVEHRLDPVLFLALIPYSLLMLYGVLGFSPVLAKLTLLSNVQTNRLVLPIGYLDTVLLVRSLALRQQELTEAGPSSGLSSAPIAASICSIVLAVLFTYGAYRMASDVTSIGVLVLLFLVYTALIAPVLMAQLLPFRSEPQFNILLVASALIVATIGLCVNPAQRGTNSLTDSPTVTSAAQLVKTDPDAVWLTDSTVHGQALLTVGARVISCVHVYPDLERWYILDPSHTYEEAYNRYAHVTVHLGEEIAFDNPQPDVLNVTVRPDDLSKLGVTYWLSTENLTEWNTAHTVFVPVQKAGISTVYRVETS